MSIVKVEVSDDTPGHTEPIITNRFIFTDQGYLQLPLQDSLRLSFRKLQNYAAEGSLSLSTAHGVGEMLDQILLAVKRPRRWGPMHTKFITDIEADGDILLAKDRIIYLRQKCDQMARMCNARLFTLEALDGFISVLEPILLEAAESEAPGVIGHMGAPDSETVSLLSRDQRDRLTRAFDESSRRFGQNTLSIGAVLDLCKTIDSMLQTLGRTPEYIVPGETVPNKDVPFNSQRAIWLGESLKKFANQTELNSLKLGSLSGFIKLVNITLTG